LKVAGGSLLIALLLTVLKSYNLPASYESMFTTNIAWTVLQGIVWFAVFTLIFQFHPWHALGLGLVTMLLVTGLATMGVDSVLSPSAATPAAARATVSSQPVRQSLAPAGGALPSQAAPKAKAP
jgi:magnesium-transporting ATPase (P-type)